LYLSLLTLTDKAKTSWPALKKHDVNLSINRSFDDVMKVFAARGMGNKETPKKAAKK
jgi:hypothetical protein